MFHVSYPSTGATGMYLVNLGNASVETIHADMLKGLGVQRGEVLQVDQSIFVVDADDIARVLRADIEFLDENGFVDDGRKPMMN